MMNKIFIGVLFALSAFLVGMPIAQADYPDKPVSFVVPWPPGDLEDVLTRMIAEDFQDKYGVAAAVVNKPGGGGGPFPGAMEVAAADPDGSMIGSFVIGVPVVGPNLGIEGLTEDTFESLGIFLTYPFVLAAAGDAPYSSMSQLAYYAKSNKVSLGHFGDPLTPTAVSKAAAKILGFEWGSDAAFDMLDCNSLASGDADVINTTIQLILPCLNDVKVLVAVTNERISKVPNTPRIGELIPELDIFLWNGLFVGAGTPQDVKDKITAVAKQTMQSDRAQEVAANSGALVYWMDADASDAQIQKDKETMATINGLL
jgi:tripartite-type tricarboxylate transporter receptor subunit TctC